MTGDYPDRNSRRGKKIVFFLLFLLLVLVLGAAVRFLWNAVLPEAVGAKPLTYPQALGLFVLCRMLFGNFGWRKSGGAGPQRNFFRDRFRNMSEEERKRLRAEWKIRFRR